MTNNSVEMGWGAAPMKTQHPILSDDEAAHFDKDNEAISRLVLRRILTQSQTAKAREAYVRQVGQAIRAALAQETQP